MRIHLEPGNGQFGFQNRSRFGFSDVERSSIRPTIGNICRMRSRTTIHAIEGLTAPTEEPDGAETYMCDSEIAFFVDRGPPSGPVPPDI